MAINHAGIDLQDITIGHFDWTIYQDGDQWHAISKSVLCDDFTASTEAELLEMCKRQGEEWGDPSGW